MSDLASKNTGTSNPNSATLIVFDNTLFLRFKFPLRRIGN